MPRLTQIEKNIHKAAKDGDLKILKKVTKLGVSKKRWVNSKQLDSKDQDDTQKTPLLKVKAYYNHGSNYNFISVLLLNTWS